MRYKEKRDVTLHVNGVSCSVFFYTDARETKGLLLEFGCIVGATGSGNSQLNTVISYYTN